MTTPVSSAADYESMSQERQPFMNLGHRASALTLPRILPKDGASADSLPLPFQSIGSRGVNNIGSKLLLALFPPNTPFFKLVLPEKMLAELGDPNDPVVQQVRAEVEGTLISYEREVMRLFDARHLRVPLHEALKHLTVTGNALYYAPVTGKHRIFPLDRYVVARDAQGEWTRIIIKEMITKDEMNPQEREAANASGSAETETGMQYQKDFARYTDITRDPAAGTARLFQSIGSEIIFGSRFEFTSLDAVPYIPLRFNAVSVESYGAGHVEDHMGDLATLEGLSENLGDAAAIMSFILFLVNPGGRTSVADVQDAKSGDFRSGAAEDVTTLQANKFADIQAAYNFYVDVQTRLSFAFLLNSSVRRNAERVTAEEIQEVARELQDALGGVYSNQSQDLQLPLVSRLLFILRANGEIAALPPEVVPTIITGLEALGRSSDMFRLQSLAAYATGLGPEGPGLLKTSTVMRKAAVALNLPASEVVRTEEEIAESQNRAMLAQMVQKLGPNMVMQIGEFLRERTQQQQQPGGPPTGQEPQQ